MMMKTTPFHVRLDELNQTGLYSHWAGYLSASRYDMSAKHEYFAVRNSAGFFDTSPLYKYRITGPDAEAFLAGIMTRDVRRCRPGQAMYTVWCDDAGYVLEDGVVFRHSDDDWLLTAAEANLGYLESLRGSLRVEFEDVSEGYGILAVQGPRSREILAKLAPEVNDLAFFGLTPAKIGAAPVTISRTGYTGDLGFEVIVETDVSFNATRTWNTNGSDFDTQAVAAHEFGHTLGIHHTNLTSTPRPTMYATYFGTDGRSLHSDDQQALQCAESRY